MNFGVGCGAGDVGENWDGPVVRNCASVGGGGGRDVFLEGGLRESFDWDVRGRNGKNEGDNGSANWGGEDFCDNLAY